jgi:hypothetical protein
MLHGNDVSGHQGPKWKPADGDDFVFVKATEGRTYFSEVSVDQLKTARAAELVVGHYHFLWPGNVEEQASYFVSKIADLKPGDLLVCDWENTPGGHPSVEDAKNLIAEVKRLKPDHKCGLYCNKSDWLNTTVKKGDFLWVAAWNVSAGIKDWEFWQYTDKPIDQNWGSPQWQTKDDLRAWTLQDPDTPIFWSDTWKSEYLAFGGSAKWITPIDKTILIACAQASGWGSVRIVQGGLRAHTSFSGWTHNGLGVGDIGIDGRSKAQVWDFCAHLRRSGIRPFPRGYGGDPWKDEKHIHFGSRESYDHAHPDLKAQVREQEAGGDGLKGSGKYNGPSYADLGRWADSPYNPANIKIDTGLYEVITDTLTGYTVDKVAVRKRDKGYVVQAARQIDRWGRWNVVTKTPTYYDATKLRLVELT